MLISHLSMSVVHGHLRRTLIVSIANLNYYQLNDVNHRLVNDLRQYCRKHIVNFI